MPHALEVVEHARTLPPSPERLQRDIRLHLALGPHLIAFKGYAASEVERVFERARELCQQDSTTPAHLPALSGLCSFYAVSSNFNMANELAEQLLRQAQRMQDDAAISTAEWQLGMVQFFLGTLPVAIDHFERSLDGYPSASPDIQLLDYGQDSKVVSQAYLAIALWARGFPEQGRRALRNSLSWARDVAHPFSLAFALSMAAAFHWFCLDVQMAYELAEEVIAYSAEQGIAQWVEHGKIIRSWALAVQGQGQEAVVALERGCIAWQGTGAKLARSMYFVMLADAYRHVGSVSEGLKVLDQARDVVDESNEYLWEAEILRLRGELLLEQSPPDEILAEECFQQSLKVAKWQNAKGWELRTAISLSRLWHQQGKRDKSYKLLADVYGSFTEGFDTTDGQKATDLIKKLAADHLMRDEHL